MRTSYPMNQVYEVHIGQTRYTAERQPSGPFVKLTRHNSDGQTKVFFPAELLWKLVENKIQERMEAVLRGVTRYKNE